jgi:hypothetical protein
VGEVSDTLLLSSFPPQQIHTQDGLFLAERASDGWERQIIIEAKQDEFLPSVLKKPLQGFMLDARSVREYGYSVCVWISGCEPIELDEGGRSATQFQSVNSIFPLIVECKRPQDTFRLVTTRLRDNMMSVDFYVELDSEDDDDGVDNGTLLPSGDLAKVLLKRKVESGKPIRVIQILIERTKRTEKGSMNLGLKLWP